MKWGNDINPQPGLASPFMQALHGRKLRLGNTPNRGHPVTAYGLLHYRLLQATDRFLHLMKEEAAIRKQEGWNSVTERDSHALDAFQEMVYRVAELFDYYENDIRSYFLPPSGRALETYKSSIKKFGRFAKIICNKCKHNHAFLIPIEGYFASGEWLAGFSLYYREGDELLVHPDLHVRSWVFSYHWALRELFIGLWRADVALAELIAVLPDVAGTKPFDCISLAYPHRENICSIAELPLICMPGEHTEPKLNFVTNEKEIGIEVSQPLLGTGDFTICIIANIYGTGINITTPYKVITANIRFGAEIPTALFTRFSFNNCVVPPANYLITRPTSVAISK